jgi:hypothetical protein
MPAVASRSLTGADQALMYALSGLARSGATRSGYVRQNALISIGGIWTGADASRRVLVASLSIQDQLNETPNTCNFTVQGDRPMEGAEIVITVGSTANGARLFAGHILRVTEVYAAQNPQPRNVLWHVEGIDYTWRLNARLVYGRYTSQPGHAVAQDLFDRFAPPGFGLYFRVPLVSISEISFTDTPFMEALAQIATRCGANVTCDYYHAIIYWQADLMTSDVQPPPLALTPSHPSLESLSYTRDLSQIVTRAIVEGGGVNALADVAPGATVLPVDDVAWYQEFGGKVTAGPQRLTYTGLVPGGTGALIGTGATVTPSSAPTYAKGTGTGLPLGTYKYAYTWQSATGETIPSPILSVSMAPLSSPTEGAGTTGLGGPPGALTLNKPYDLSYVYSEDAPGGSGFGQPVTHTGLSEIVWGMTGGTGSIGVQVQYSSNPAVKSIWIARVGPPLPGLHYDGTRIANDPSKGGQYSPTFYITGPADNSGLWGTTEADGSNNTGQGTVTLGGIAVGPSGVVGRRVYRSARNALQLKLHTTIANNTATAIAVDTTADASLGANAPTSDTAGLISTVGNVQAGSTAIPVSSVGPFGSLGWALIGSQRVRYASVSATALTGIPASGAGSLTATVNYGTEILAAPLLTGIPASGSGAIRLAIKQGDPVNLLVIIDDAAAQAAMAALTGADGIIEGALSDNRISQGEAISRGEAMLAQKKDPQITVRYRTRDPTTRSGATITIDLPVLGITGTYQIQDVRIGGFLGTNLAPTYDATASSQRLTFEDLLRQMRTKVRTQPA